MKKSIAILALCLMTAATAYGTSLGTAYIKYYDRGVSDTAYVTLNGTTKHVYTGLYTFRMINNASKPATGEGLTLWDQIGGNIVDNDERWFRANCFDINEEANSGYLRYDVRQLADTPVGGPNTPMGASKAHDLQELFYRHYNPLGNATHQEAFAAAVWEVIFEAGSRYSGTATPNANPYAFGSGQLKVSGLNNLTLASSFLADITGALDAPTLSGLRALTREGAQDYGLPILGVDQPPVPEPVTFVSCGLAIAALGRYVRRRIPVTA